MVLITLAIAAPHARSQAVHEDLAPCPGSAPEPSQTGAWSVAFCNRTGHDLVLEFHDNDCPANDWSRRGDVYQRTLHKDESKTFPLCYASEPPGKKPAPGVPALRIPGGKGVVTTWSVVGDCGERSRALSLDGRSFYDRGEYRTGIVLLQYPAGSSHCAADGAGAAAAGSSGTSSLAASAGGAAASSASRSSPSEAMPAAPRPYVTAPPSPAATTSAPVSTPPPVNPRGKGMPTLTATIDAKDVIGRTVRVFAKDGAGYQCSFNLALTFTDGGSWNDRANNIGITAGDADAPIATRKYLKSVSKAQITSSKCVPL